jgi:hypothetical protein
MRRCFPEPPNDGCWPAPLEGPPPCFPEPPPKNRPAPRRLGLLELLRVLNEGDWRET